MGRGKSRGLSSNGWIGSRPCHYMARSGDDDDCTERVACAAEI